MWKRRIASLLIVGWVTLTPIQAFATSEPSPTAEPSPSSTSSPTPEVSSSADPTAGTTNLETGTCSVETPCVVQLADSQFGELHAAAFVLVFCSLVYVLAWIGRRGRD